MQGVKFLIIITHREFSEHCIKSLKQTGAKSVISKLCKGTATDELLNFLDLEKTEKIMIETMVYDHQAEQIKNTLVKDLKFSSSGNGIAMLLPVDGLGGNFARNYFLEQGESKKEIESMEQSKYVLILTICNNGYSDVVMDAAREAGATGGTVSRAQGTGAELAKFFGVTISEEKEMVYIASKRENRDKIMYAIMEKAGKDSPAFGVVFALPVEKIMGVASLED